MSPDLAGGVPGFEGNQPQAVTQLLLENTWGCVRSLRTGGEGCVILSEWDQVQFEHSWGAMAGRGALGRAERRPFGCPSGRGRCLLRALGCAS